MVIKRVNPISASKISGVLGAIVIMPIFYGVFMFVMGLIQAALYNVAAKWMGGLEIDAA